MVIVGFCTRENYFNRFLGAKKLKKLPTPRMRIWTADPFLTVKILVLKKTPEIFFFLTVEGFTAVKLSAVRLTRHRAETPARLSKCNDPLAEARSQKIPALCLFLNPSSVCPSGRDQPFTSDRCAGNSSKCRYNRYGVNVS